MGDKRRLGTSEEFRQRYLARRTTAPLVVQGVGKPRLIMIAPKDFKRLNVDDEAYQRTKITAEINEMIHALRAGGLVPDPVTVAERPDGTWYIADGQQRFMAHVETELPMAAMIYPVETMGAEKLLFLAMNQSRRVGAGFIVHAWPGEMAELLRKADNDPESVLFNAVNFGRHGNRYAAATLIRSAVSAVSGVDWHGTGVIQQVLARSDTLMRATGATERIHGIWGILRAVFARGPEARAFVCIGFGIVAGRRWKDRVLLPSARDYTRLREIGRAHV